MISTSQVEKTFFEKQPQSTGKLQNVQQHSFLDNETF